MRAARSEGHDETVTITSNLIIPAPEIQPLDSVSPAT